MFNSYAVGTTAAVGLFAVTALAFAVSVHSNRSSDAARNEFMSASVSKPDQSNSQGSGLPARQAEAANPNYTIAVTEVTRRGGGFFAKVVFNPLKLSARDRTLSR
jgi:hypothetical protein